MKLAQAESGTLGKLPGYPKISGQVPKILRAGFVPRPVVHAYIFAGCTPFLTRLGCRCFHVDEFCKRRPVPWRRHPRAGQRLKCIHLVRSGW